MRRVPKISNKAKAELYKDQYRQWRENRLKQGGYFIIFNDLKNNNILKELSGNALKLYIYLGLYSKNRTGESWHSLGRMARYFQKTERTILNWLRELENYGLITRFQLEVNDVSYTFLRPYSSSPDDLSGEKK